MLGTLGHDGIFNRPDIKDLRHILPRPSMTEAHTPSRLCNPPPKFSRSATQGIQHRPGNPRAGPSGGSHDVRGGPCWLLCIMPWWSPQQPQCSSISTRRAPLSHGVERPLDPFTSQSPSSIFEAEFESDSRTLLSPPSRTANMAGRRLGVDQRAVDLLDQSSQLTGHSKGFGLDAFKNGARTTKAPHRYVLNDNVHTAPLVVMGIRNTKCPWWQALGPEGGTQLAIRFRGRINIGD